MKSLRRYLVLGVVGRYITQDRAVANARSATTALCAARVERDEVTQYLQARALERRGTRTA